MPPSYEAIFSGQTSSTQQLAGKAAWIASLSLDETEIEEPDKLAKFSAACIRLSTAATELELYITDDLNRHNYEALQKQPQEALALATASGIHWKDKKQKDLQVVKNLKNTFSWNDLFSGLDKDALLQIIEQHYQNDQQFKAAVDSASSPRVAYIAELALTKKLYYSTPPEDMLKRFRAYVLEECAGVLALRLKGYTDAFYLAKLNPATALIATTQFTLKEGDDQERTNEILTKINQTPLKFHIPSQYKSISKSPPLSANRSSRPPMPQYQLHRNTAAPTGANADRFWTAFFDSDKIPLKDKLELAKTHMGGAPSERDNLDAANSEDFADMQALDLASGDEQRLAPASPPKGEALLPAINGSPAFDS